MTHGQSCLHPLQYTIRHANEIPHTGLCFATIVVAQDIRISHERKLAVLIFSLKKVFVLLRSDQMFLMKQGSQEIAFSCSAFTEFYQ